MGKKKEKKYKKRGKLEIETTNYKYLTHMLYPDTSIRLKLHWSFIRVLEIQGLTLLPIPLSDPSVGGDRGINPSFSIPAKLKHSNETSGVFAINHATVSVQNA